MSIRSAVGIFTYTHLQLGKYNKDAKPKKKEKTATVTRDTSNKSDDEEEVEKLSFTLKQVNHELSHSLY